MSNTIRIMIIILIINEIILTKKDVGYRNDYCRINDNDYNNIISHNQNINYSQYSNNNYNNDNNLMIMMIQMEYLTNNSFVDVVLFKINFQGFFIYDISYYATKTRFFS